MVKQIETLVQDIYEVLGGSNPFDLPEELAEKFADRMKHLVQSRVGTKHDRKPRLSISSVGKPCERQVWYQVNRQPELEKLDPSTRLKFLYGDCIEELLLFLAEAAGHSVQGCQTELELEGVKGSRDAVIDGVLIDVKSASTFSFKKFKDGNLIHNDPFGYIGQIQTYLEASQDDPVVTDKTRCAFLVMDKTLGHICLDIHQKVPFDVRAITKAKLEMTQSEVEPQRAFHPEPMGKAGNMKLPMTCSYCNAKKLCYPASRTFIYSSGPVYLTTVKKVPDVPEV